MINLVGTYYNLFLTNYLSIHSLDIPKKLRRELILGNTIFFPYILFHNIEIYFYKFHQNFLFIFTFFNFKFLVQVATFILLWYKWIIYKHFSFSFSELMFQDRDNCEWSDESSSDYDMKSDDIISSLKTKSRKRVEVRFIFIFIFSVLDWFDYSVLLFYSCSILWKVNMS